MPRRRFSAIILRRRFATERANFWHRCTDRDHILQILLLAISICAIEVEPDDRTMDIAGARGEALEETGEVGVAEGTRPISSPLLDLARGRVGSASEISLGCRADPLHHLGAVDLNRAGTDPEFGANLLVGIAFDGQREGKFGADWQIGMRRDLGEP